MLTGFPFHLRLSFLHAFNIFPFSGNVKGNDENLVAAKLAEYKENLTFLAELDFL